MRIESFYITGFGQLTDVGLEDISPGVSIVHGNNEAGKTTLLAFLRAVLFGLPTRKQKEFYQPVLARRKGGRVVLVDGRGRRLTVERFEGRGNGPVTITLPDGSQGGEEDFRQYMGSATADLYGNVFAFSLSELQSVKSLETEKVRDTIYSAGLGLGQKSIADLTDGLRQQAGELFAPGGAKPVINKLLSRLDDISTQLKNHRHDQDQHYQYHAELRDREKALSEADMALRRDRRRIERVKVLQLARKDWVLIGTLDEEISQLPETEGFPEDGLRRVELLSTEERSFADQLSEAEAETARLRAQLASNKVDENVIQASQTIRDLDRRLNLYHQECDSRASLRAQCEAAQKGVSEAIRALGPDWNEPKLRTLDLSVGVLVEITAAARQIEDAGRAVRDARIQLQQRTEQRGDAATRATRSAEKLGELTGVAEGLDRENIQILERGREHYQSAREDLPDVQSQCETRVAELTAILAEAGQEWSESRIERVSGFGEMIRDIRAMRDKIKKVVDDRMSAEKEVAQATETRERVEEEHAAAARELEQLSPSTATEAELNQRKHSLKRLRVLLADVQHLRSHIGSLEARNHDFEVLDIAGRGRSTSSSARIPVWAAPALVVLGVAGLLILGFTQERGWLVGILIAGVCVVLAAAVYTTRQASLAVGVGDRAEPHLREVEKQRAEIRKELREARERLAKADASVHHLSLDVGLDGSVEIPAIDEAEDAVETQAKLLALRSLTEGQVTALAGKVHQARDREAQRATTWDLATRRAEDEEARWHGWLSGKGLPNNLLPDDAIELVGRLEAGKEKLKAIATDRERIKRMRTYIESYEQRVADTAAHSGLADKLPEGLEAAVQFLGSQKRAQEDLARDRHNAEQQVEEAQTAFAKCEERARDAKRGADEAEVGAAEAAAQWRSLLERLGFRATLSTDSVQTLIDAIRQARHQLRQLDDVRAKESAAAVAVGEFVGAVRALYHKLGRDEPAEDGVAEAVTTLTKELDDAEGALCSAEADEMKLEEYRGRIEQLQGRREKRREQISKLFGLACVKDEEEFRRKATAHDRRRECDMKRQDAEARLRELAGGEEAVAALKDELRGATPDALASEFAELEESVNRHEREQRSAADARGRLSQQLKQLESAEEVSLLRVEANASRSQIELVAQKWAVVRICAHLITKAREKYERERRPAVLRDAEQYFERFTHGAYSEIHALGDGSTRQLAVRGPDGVTKDLSQLSRGTAEQLYLSLRLGFVKEFVGRSAALPLVFDDIMVNFDPQRARSVAECVCELGESLQVLFFTCHPETVELIREVDGNVPVHELVDGTFETVSS